MNLKRNQDNPTSILLLFINLIAKQLYLLIHLTLYVVEVIKFSMLCSWFPMLVSLVLFPYCHFICRKKKHYIGMITNNGAMLCLRLL